MFVWHVLEGLHVNWGVGSAQEAVEGLFQYVSQHCEVSGYVEDDRNSVRCVRDVLKTQLDKLKEVENERNLTDPSQMEYWIETNELVQKKAQKPTTVDLLAPQYPQQIRETLFAPSGSVARMRGNTTSLNNVVSRPHIFISRCAIQSPSDSASDRFVQDQIQHRFECSDCSRSGRQASTTCGCAEGPAERPGQPGMAREAGQ